MIQDNIEKGNPYERDFFRDIYRIFRQEMCQYEREGKLDAFLEKVYSTVKARFPVNLACVKMACNGDNFIRRQGNQAAHEFSAAEIHDYLYVEKGGLSKESLKPLRKMFYVVYPNGIEVDASTSTDVENEWGTRNPFDLLSCIDI